MLKGGYMKKFLISLIAIMTVGMLCTSISAEGTDQNGCSVEHPELCIEPMGCSSPDCMWQ